MKGGVQCLELEDIYANLDILQPNQIECIDFFLINKTFNMA